MDPFQQEVDRLRSDLGPAASREDLLRMLEREAELFGVPRGDDPAPALRLLAFDGLLTEMLGAE